MPVGEYSKVASNASEHDFQPGQYLVHFASAAGLTWGTNGNHMTLLTTTGTAGTYLLDTPLGGSMSVPNLIVVTIMYVGPASGTFNFKKVGT